MPVSPSLRTNADRESAGTAISFVRSHVLSYVSPTLSWFFQGPGRDPETVILLRQHPHAKKKKKYKI